MLMINSTPMITPNNTYYFGNLFGHLLGCLSGHLLGRLSMTALSVSAFNSTTGSGDA